MKFEEKQIYHVFNQGNNRQKIFFEPENYRFFTRKIQRYICSYADVLCYCLMPNHFHLLVSPNAAASQPSKAVKPRRKWGEIEPGANDDRQEKLSHAIGTMLSSYTKAVNKRYQRSGSLFRGKTKVKHSWTEGTTIIEGPGEHQYFLRENNYARTCFHYIHQNPVKAGLVLESTDWAYSSAQDYAGLGNESLCNKVLAKELGLI
ncbi:MAG: transposase [Bacteroidota bacterium]